VLKNSKSWGVALHPNWPSTLGMTLMAPSEIDSCVSDVLRKIFVYYTYRARSIDYLFSLFSEM
jgi:hypothetical protein